jgi:hypothetical protein
MLKQIFIAGSLLIASISAYAVDEIPKLYNFDFKDSKGTISFSLTTPIGKIMPIQVIQEDKDKRSTCLLTLDENGGSATLEANQKVDIGLTATIYPSTIKDDDIKLMLVFNKKEYVASEQPHDTVKLGETCEFSNSLSVVENTDLQWIGDVKVGKKVKVKLSNDNTLFITATEVKPEA